MIISISATCKHCDRPIRKRNEVQGWVHSDGSSRCDILRHAEPNK